MERGIGPHIRACITADHDDRHLGVLGSDFEQDAHTGAIAPFELGAFAQIPIEKEQAEGILAQGAAGVGIGSHVHRPDPLLLKELHHDAAKHGIVVDDQDPAIRNGLRRRS